MDQQQIGRFLKALRKQKGLTQEKLAEQLGVSGRSVSRWENGNNLPDLSILVELADFYEVDIREIIDGERKSEIMDREMKDTLLKVADYGDAQKQRVAQAGNIAFGITFILCAVTIIVQLLINRDMAMVLGETLVFLVGGIAYLMLAVRSGAFDSATKGSRANYTKISVICGGVFSVILFLFMVLRGGNIELMKIILITLLFFVVMTLMGRLVLSLLSRASDKNAADSAPDR